MAKDKKEDWQCNRKEYMEARRTLDGYFTLKAKHFIDYPPLGRQVVEPVEEGGDDGAVDEEKDRLIDKLQHEIAEMKGVMATREEQGEMVEVQVLVEKEQELSGKLEQQTQERTELEARLAAEIAGREEAEARVSSGLARVESLERENEAVTLEKVRELTEKLELKERERVELEARLAAESAGRQEAEARVSSGTMVEGSLVRDGEAVVMEKEQALTEKLVQKERERAELEESLTAERADRQVAEAGALVREKSLVRDREALTSHRKEEEERLEVKKKEVELLTSKLIQAEAGRVEAETKLAQASAGTGVKRPPPEDSLGKAEGRELKMTRQMASTSLMVVTASGLDEMDIGAADETLSDGGSEAGGDREHVSPLLPAAAAHDPPSAAPTPPPLPPRPPGSLPAGPALQEEVGLGGEDGRGGGGTEADSSPPAPEVSPNVVSGIVPISKFQFSESRLSPRPAKQGYGRLSTGGLESSGSAEQSEGDLEGESSNSSF
jgi:hypothetical protein